jgi:signal transduction histidine kinase
MAPRPEDVTALQLLQLLTNASFLLVFLAVLARAIRRPSRESMDVALFFGAPAVSISQGWIVSALGLPSDPTLSLISGVLVLAMPLLTLRVIQSFTDLPRAVVPAAAVGWVLSALALASAPAPMPAALTVPVLLYFVAFEGYAGLAVFRATRHARGVTRRRLQFVALGTALLAALILVAGFAVVLPILGLTAAAPIVTSLTSVMALSCALAYLAGFAPPGPLRRAWQAPEVLEFVRRTNRLVGEAAPELVNVEIARQTAAAIGASEAAVCLWDGTGMRIWPARAAPFDRPDAPGRFLAMKEQRPVVTHDDPRRPQRMAEPFREQGLCFTLQAPITAGGQRFGVLAAFSRRASLFVDDDLALLELLAGHTAIVLEHRRLFDEVSSLNRSLERSVGELRAVNDELASFAYSVSHDLRAPLRSIDGFSQVLLEDKADALGDDGREHLGRVRAAARRMGALIDDLLMLSRLTRDEMRAEPVDLTAMARSIADELRAREPRRRVEFESDGALPATGDTRLLRIVLTNLIGNAWKFTRDRDVAHIAFGGESRDGEARFFVRDDGAGFDMRYAQKLFGAFQRLHTTTEFEGTGIGLATVQRIIHRHGGRVWAEGAVDQGATFYFTLPEAEKTPTRT